MAMLVFVPGLQVSSSWPRSQKPCAGFQHLPDVSFLGVASLHPPATAPVSPPPVKNYASNFLLFHGSTPSKSPGGGEKTSLPVSGQNRVIPFTPIVTNCMVFVFKSPYKSQEVFFYG